MFEKCYDVHFEAGRGKIMDLNPVVGIGRRGPFTLMEARNLLVVVRSITEKYAEQVDKKIVRLEALGSSQDPLVRDLEGEVNQLIDEWNDKVQKLGGVPRGLWLVDFDSGHGYFCWKYPERDILYWHSYSDGFSGRIPIQNIPEYASREQVSIVKESENRVLQDP